MSYYLTPHLERIDFQNGDRAFCKPCDSVQPMTLAKSMLRCPSGHDTHPANLVVNGSHRR